MGRPQLSGVSLIIRAAAENASSGHSTVAGDARGCTTFRHPRPIGPRTTAGWPSWSTNVPAGNCEQSMSCSLRSRDFGTRVFHPSTAATAYLTYRDDQKLHISPIISLTRLTSWTVGIRADRPLGCNVDRERFCQAQAPIGGSHSLPAATPGNRVDGFLAVTDSRIR
jgi:hypothetical protein